MCYSPAILPVSVLKTFIHDPLVEWGKGRGVKQSTEKYNEKVTIGHTHIVDR